MAEVYDNERAAGLRSAALSQDISAADGAFFDKHKVADYTKNGNTGYHRFVITVGGLDGPWINIDYH